jgi:hypothetical protein
VSELEAKLITGHHACTQRHIHQQRIKPLSIQARTRVPGGWLRPAFKSSSQASFCRRIQAGSQVCYCDCTTSSLYRQKEICCSEVLRIPALCTSVLRRQQTLLAHVACCNWLLAPNCVCNRRLACFDYQHKKWSEINYSPRPLGVSFFVFVFLCFSGEARFWVYHAFWIQFVCLYP